MRSLTDFVQERGGTIILMAGENYMPNAYENTPLGGLFPFRARPSSPTKKETLATAGSSAVVLAMRPTDLAMNDNLIQIGSNPANSNEFFYIEAKIESDKGRNGSVPDEGLLIWHIDERIINENLATNTVNADLNRRGVDLEEADLSALMAAGYQFPEPYQVKSADGITDMYGVMYKPYDFDPDKTYPIVEYVYPGPQTESVSKFWSTNQYEQGLAQFGFIVVTVGNRGGHPDRSKWYHNYGYGNLRDYGLADKKAAGSTGAFTENSSSL